MPVLLEKLNPRGKGYSSMKLQYGSLLLQMGQKEKAVTIFKEAYKQTSDAGFIHGLVRHYDDEKQYDKIIGLEK